MAHKTYKGTPIDMGAILMMNEHAVALGNANLNARGDELGKGGIVVKTSEEIAHEYYENQATNAVNTDEDLALTSPVVEPKKEEVDLSLLSGYDAEEVVEPVKPTRKKAPTADQE